MNHANDNIIEEIRRELFEMQDKQYADFQCRLTPTMERQSCIGVRTPLLKKYAKELIKNDRKDAFLDDLPHIYFDENQLHAFVISNEKDITKCLEEVERFLPFVDNWATCDQLLPTAFKKNHEIILPYALKWISSNETYTIRYGIGTLMRFFLDEDFDIKYLDIVSSIRSDEYYVNMMSAWYFATALTKQYESTLPFFETSHLDSWTHNKAIQKACESFKVSDEHKDYLRSLKVKK